MMLQTFLLTQRSRLRLTGVDGVETFHKEVAGAFRGFIDKHRSSYFSRGVRAS